MFVSEVKTTKTKFLHIGYLHVMVLKTGLD